jgi:hypothetical protein
MLQALLLLCNAQQKKHFYLNFKKSTFDKTKKTNMKTKEKVQTETTPEIQKLKVELSVQEWEAVLAVIEQSSSPHIQVKAVAAELVKQLQPQIKDDKPQPS